MNALYSILVIVLAIILLALVAVRNFKRLRMGCFFDLEARDNSKLQTPNSKLETHV